jgi:group I intron endonuclease
MARAFLPQTLHKGRIAVFSSQALIKAPVNGRFLDPPINIGMKKVCFVIYKTVNMINGKYYIGKHKTVNPDDSYLGSGVALTSAIQKYGVDSFVKEILFIFDNKHDMDEKESELVTEAVINDPLSYNIALGGQGGNLGPEVNKKIGLRMSQILKGKPKSESHKIALKNTEFAKTYKPTQSTKDKIKQTLLETWSLMPSTERKMKCGKPGEKNPFYGKQHRLDSIDKMKSTIGDSRKGSKNPNAKPVTVYGKSYTTRKECLEDLGISKRKLQRILGEI